MDIKNKLRGKNIFWFLLLLILAVAFGGLTAFFDILSLPIVLAIGFFIVAALAVFKNPFIGVMLVTFFLPFERLGTIEVASFTLKINHILGLITILAWFLMMIVRKEIKWKKYPIFVPLIVFIIINILSFSQAINIFRALSVLVFTLFAVLISLAVNNLVTSRDKLEKIVKVLLLSAIVVSCFGIFQFVGDLIGLPESITGLRDLYTKEIFGFPRVHSTALEPLYFANYLLIPISLALVLILSKKGRIKWFWLVLIIIVFLTNFILALSRAAYIAFAFTLLTIFIAYFKNFFSLKKILSFLIIIILVYAIFMRIFNLTGDSTFYFDKFTTQATDIFSGASFYDRTETYGQAWWLFKTHPWLGVGTGNFGPQVALYPLVQPEKGWLIVNNEFLEILAETGIFGFLSFFFVLAILFFRSVKAIRRAKDEFLKAVMIGLLAAFVGIIVQYQTFSILYIIHIWFLFGLMIAVQNIILNQEEK